MTRIRRSLLLLALTFAVVLAGAGSTAPAQATFGDSAGVSLGTISTATVAAPTNVVGGLSCGRTSATMSVTWQPSTSARVSGYLVTVYFSDGYVQTVQKAATDTSWSASIDPYWVTVNSVRYSVTTQTDYGWTTESALTGTYRC